MPAADWKPHIGGGYIAISEVRLSGFLWKGDIMVELSKNLLVASLPGASYWLLGLVLLPM